MGLFSFLLGGGGGGGDGGDGPTITPTGGGRRGGKHGEVVMKWGDKTSIPVTRETAKFIRGAGRDHMPIDRDGGR